MLVASAAATAAAKSAARLKADFLSTMSHEIRTPMSGVLGMAELLERTELTEKQKLYVSTILGSGEALTTIINDVLDLAKIDAGKMTVRTHPFDLATLIEDVALLLSPRAAEKNTELTVRVQPGLPSNFVGDAGHIRQVITNLAGNAVKFTDNGTVLLDISGDVESDKASLTISIEDTGVGIPADHLPHLFRRFEQVKERDPTSLVKTKKQKGTGLGLAISKKLVGLMGGKIGATSVDGKGSRFWFTVDLPVDQHAVADDGTPQDIAGARILVVDDNPINRAVTVEQLRSRALEAEAVADANAALVVLRETSGTNNAYDLAVLDYHMPGKDGLELAAEIRGDSRIASTPLLMLTSIMNAGDDDVFQTTKIDGHLSKPVRVSLMFETIVDVLRRSKFRSRTTAPDQGKAPDPTETPTETSAGTAETHSRRTAQSTESHKYPRRHDPRSPLQGTGRR
jgi:nitrogen-specific signal transduction histidine kinase/DNA-binding response OmpR family regulator